MKFKKGSKGRVCLAVYPTSECHVVMYLCIPAGAAYDCNAH